MINWSAGWAVGAGRGPCVSSVRRGLVSHGRQPAESPLSHYVL